MTIVCRAMASLAMVLMAVGASAQTASVEEILTTLRAGGHVLVLRHGATHTDQADTDPLNLDNVAKQRQLNDKGRADARALGDALKRAGVPIGKVYSSRFQRAIETARLVAGKEPETTVPEAGTNTLIVTHRPNILDALGKDYFDVREGETSIFKPDSGAYTLVGRVQIAQWATLK